MGGSLLDLEKPMAISRAAELLRNAAADPNYPLRREAGDFSSDRRASSDRQEHVR